MSDGRDLVRRLVNDLGGLSAERRGKARARAESVRRLGEAVARGPSRPAAPVRGRVSEPGPAAGGEGADPLAALRRVVLACERCPHLVAARTRVVFGVGDPRAELMFVGEAPGADEDRRGEPFVGRAGQLLTRIIETMGLSRETVYIGNVLKCRPDTGPGRSGNRPPTREEMATCLPYLLEQIALIRPRVIVALGRVAMEGLGFISEGARVGDTVGNWRELIVPGGKGAGEGLTVPVMPTYHPSYLLRNPTAEMKAVVWQHMLQVMERLGMSISERQRSYFS